MSDDTCAGGSNQEILKKAASTLRAQEQSIYHERATKSTPPIEESEAYEIADELERLAHSLHKDTD